MDYDFEVAQAVMTRHYLLLVFLLSLGSLQVGASIGGVRGLWLLSDKRWNIALGIALGLAGLVIFTVLPLWTDGPWEAGSVVDGTSESRSWGTAAFEDLTRSRNLNDIHGGLNGGDYGAWFPLTALAAVGFSVVVAAIRLRVAGSASVARYRMDLDGFDALSQMDWFAALRVSRRRLRRTLWIDLVVVLMGASKWTLPKLLTRRWLHDRT